MLLIPAVALAQGTTATSTAPAPNVPATPAATATDPADFGNPVVVNTPGAAPAAKGAAGAKGYSGGDLIISDTNPALYGQGSGTAKIPRFYMVKKGDSLWKVCDFHYGDPWAWPQLWAYNKTITNPHWIYPGDRLRMLKASKPSTRTQPEPEKVSKLQISTRYARRAVQLHQKAFVEEKELVKSGEIFGSKEEKEMLSRFDEMYVLGQKQFKPRIGKLYSIYRVIKELKSHKGKKIGYLVKILGTARIKRLPKDKAATAVILEAYDAIERKDRIGPLRRTFRPLPLKPADKDLEARVIANLDDNKLVGTDRIVFIDSGKKQGVRVGNRFLVIRRGDGFATMMQEDIDEDELKKYPDETVAEISVLDTREEACVGLVTRALKEVRNKDLVRLRRGY